MFEFAKDHIVGRLNQEAVCQSKEGGWWVFIDSVLIFCGVNIIICYNYYIENLIVPRNFFLFFSIGGIALCLFGGLLTATMTYPSFKRKVLAKTISQQQTEEKPHA